MGIKRCIILAVLLPTLLVSACLPSSLVSAASDYDDVYNSTTSLSVSDPSFSDDDITLDWFSQMFDKDVWTFRGYNSEQTYNEKKQYAEEVINNPSQYSWYVVQVTDENNPSFKQVIAFFVKGKITLDWTKDAIFGNANPKDYLYVSLGWSGWGVHSVSYQSNNGSYAYPLSSKGAFNGNYYKNFLTSGNVDYNYPAGYAGPEVNSAAPTTIKPKVSWDVARKDITLRFDPVELSEDYKYLFAIKRLGDVGGDLVEVSKGKEITEQIVEKNGTARVTVDSFGTYILGVWIVPADFSRDEPEYRFVKNTDSFWIDLAIDGTFFSGSSTDKDSFKNCTSDNINGQNITRCESRFLKECPLDSDHSIADFVGCQVNNFFTILTSLFKSLFIPDLSDMMSVLNSMLDFIHNKLGFIYDSVAVVGSFFGSIISNAFKPDCVLHYGVIQGKDTSLNVCQFRNTIGASSFDFVINIIRGTTVILFLFVAYHYLTRFLNGNNEVDPV